MRLKGRWNQLKGRARQQWGRLTDDDIARLEGHEEELVGVIQARYGVTVDEAKKQIDSFLDDVEEAVQPKET